MKHEISEWAVAADVWHEFCQVHQELGLKSGRMQFHNFLRRYREPLLQADAMDYIRREFAIGSDRELVTSALIYLAEQVRHGLSSLPKPESHLEEGV